MPQFFVNKVYEVGNLVEPSKEDSKHIQQVLRLKEGDWLNLSDGRHKTYRAILRKSNLNKVLLEIQEAIEINRRPGPILAQAIIKHDRIEWIIQKAIEIGASEVIPFSSERTIPKFTEKISNKKIERWNKIAMEAAKQSGLPWKPKVHEPIYFKNLCTSKRFKEKILFWEGEREKSINDYFKNFRITPNSLLIIGPEGGFAVSEIDLAKENGCITLGLGPQILRVETAAIATLSIWQYESGNMNKTL